MRIGKELVLATYVAWVAILDAIVLGIIWSVFGIEGPAMTVGFSQALVDSQDALRGVLVALVVQAAGILALVGMIRRRDAPRVYVLGSALLVASVALLALFPAFILSDVGLIITHLENLSHYMDDVPSWGVSVSPGQVNVAVAFLIVGLGRNILIILTRYAWAKALWHASHDEGIGMPTRATLRASASFHVFSFLTVLLPYGPLSLVLSSASAALAATALIRGASSSSRGRVVLARDTIEFRPTRPFPGHVVRFFGIPAFASFIALVFVPYFISVVQSAFLQQHNFGGWSFYLWGGALLLFILVYSAFHMGSPTCYTLSRIVIIIIVLVSIVQIVLNLGFLSDILAWGWWTTAGNLVQGGGLGPAPGFSTVPHAFVFLWATAILGGATLFVTKRERKGFRPPRNSVPSKPAVPRGTLATKRRIIPVLVFSVLAGAFVGSAWGYGIPIVLHPHPTIETRISFWTSGSYIPPAYLDVIHAKNNAYNTSSRFFSWGNQFTAMSGGQYLIDVPGAQYYISCAGYHAMLNASAMIAYLQRLVDARVTYWFYGGSLSSLQPMANLLANATVNATFKGLVDQVVEGFIFDIESGGSYATYNETAMADEHARRANVALFAQAMGKKMGYTTVAYTIGDWLDGDNDVATLFRIHDFHPASVPDATIPPYAMDYYNWMVYRSDQEGPERQIWDPYFSYLHFTEAKVYMDAVASRYPELGLDPSIDFGLSMGVLREGEEQVFSNTAAGRESFLVELQMANALGISEGVYFYFPYFMDLYSPADYASFYDDLHSDWEVRLYVNQFVGALGPPFGTLWDIPNPMGTRFFYHYIDHLLNDWFAVLVYCLVVSVGVTWGAGVLITWRKRHPP